VPDKSESLEEEGGFTMTTRTHVPYPKDELKGIERHLDTWVRRRLITRAEADAIAAFEAGPVERRPRTGTGPLTEALAYLGAALAVAAAGVLLGQVWDDLPTAARIAVPGTLWLALFVAGGRLWEARQPALARLARVLWILSPVALAWCMGVVAMDGLGLRERWPILWIGAAVTAYAGVLYALRPTILHQAVVVVGLSILAGGLFVSAAAIGTAIWCIGFAWILMGWRDLLVGRDATLTIGTVAALFGVTMIPAPAGLWIGLATSAALIGVSVALRQGPMLGLGGIGLFVSTTLTIQHYVQGTTGVAIGLLVAGIAMLVLALLVSRLQPTRWHGARTPRRRPRSTLHRSGPASGRGSG
jgi:hypothetical protein